MTEDWTINLSYMEAYMRKLFMTILVLLMGVYLSGCSSSPTKIVHLNNIDSQVLVKDKMPDPVPLRVAVSSILSPKETLTVYQPLIDYLEMKLGYPVILLQRKSYKEVNDLLQVGSADVAFVCSGGYAAGSESFGMELLAIPTVKNEHVYQSYIITNQNTKGDSILDLRGRSFAFTDPMSFSGRIAPVYMLESHGIDSATYFGRTFYTYSHDNAIRAVADGIADAAAVDSIVFDHTLKREPNLATKIKVIDKSIHVGIPPVVVNPSLDATLKQRVQALLLAMNEDEEGQKALRALEYDKFVTPDYQDYAHLKSIWLSTKEKL